MWRRISSRSHWDKQLIASVAGGALGACAFAGHMYRSPVRASASPLAGTYELMSITQTDDDGAMAEKQETPAASSSEVVEASEEEKAFFASSSRRRLAMPMLTVSETAPQAASQCQARRRISGLLIYLEDGRMWTQLHVTHGDGKPSYTGYAGRWWTHTGSAGGNPPHGQANLVEHHVKAASEPRLVGKTLMQQFVLSDNGRHLTTTDSHFSAGKVRICEQLEWKRIS